MFLPVAVHKSLLKLNDIPNCINVECFVTGSNIILILAFGESMKQYPRVLYTSGCSACNMNFTLCYVSIKVIMNIMHCML